MTSLKAVVLGLIISFATISSTTFADDGAFEGEGASVYPITNSDVQMVSETINIAYVPGVDGPNFFKSASWNVDVTMNFVNHGLATKIQMGFPFREPFSSDDDRSDENKELPDQDPAYGFTSYVNGKKIKTITKEGVINPIFSKKYRFKKVITFPVSFKAGETKVIRHTYSVGGESYSDGSKYFNYILRTGGLWRGVIEDCKIFLEAPADVIEEFQYISPEGYTSSLKGNILQISWSFKNFKPDFDINLTKPGIRKPDND